MTIAVDREGRVVGQLVTLMPSAPLAPRHADEITLYARGEYIRVPRSSVRLEEVR